MNVVYIGKMVTEKVCLGSMARFIIRLMTSSSIVNMRFTVRKCSSAFDDAERAIKAKHLLCIHEQVSIRQGVPFFL